MMISGLSAVLLTIAILLVVVSAIQPVARRLELPETILLAFVGVLIGGLADVLLRTPLTNRFDDAARTLVQIPGDSEIFLLIFLPILVFQGALAIDVRRLWHDLTTVLLMAVVAVMVSFTAIGFALYPFTNMSLTVCLMLGAIVANTDPSAVSAIFRDIGASSRLTRLVEGEALLNDAAAISIFTILLHATTTHAEVGVMQAAWTFVVSFVGALAVGVVMGRVTLWLITFFGGTVAGEVTLTLALPYIAYIVCDDMLGFSGVVATAAAGLTVSVYGPSTLRPKTWSFLRELWEQLVFWAGSLVFVLASMLVPRLLFGMTGWDWVLIAVALVAALAARGLILFGLLPLLTIAGLSRPVPNPYKVTIWWGGLRGAITLALALAVTENQNVSAAVAHFVGVIATGFVLITLLVNGVTLRYLVLFFKLDQLSPIDSALHHQVLALGLGEVRDKTRQLASDLGISGHSVRHVVEHLDRRIADEEEANTFDTALTDRQRVTLALITAATQERSILLDLFKIRGLSRPVMENLLRTAEAMIDGARMDGRYGYVRAARRRLQPTFRFRLAQWIHYRFRIDRLLMYAMMERFEMLMITHLISTALRRFMQRRMEPMLGGRVAEIVSEVIERREKQLSAALDTMRLHYSGYAEALESRLLRLIALRLESQEYDDMLDEALIGEELHERILRDVETRRNAFDRRLKFNLKGGIEERIRRFPALADLPDAALHDLAMTASIHFAWPGETLLERDRKPRTVYLVSAGRLEAHIAEHDIEFGPGSIVGGREVLDDRPLPATVRSLSFGHLLALSRADFRRLVAEHPVIARNVMALPEAAVMPDPQVDRVPDLGLEERRQLMRIASGSLSDLRAAYDD
ncbi:CPA1 family monovalent cation:H+ antiporter [Endobacter medicaginis]|uniref:CPA1 family monovalent cation:H+ antiporter n=1 Tax=Endobacter medicaginis TaxID=1181271 RepID=A0A839URU7_9PROT|nr:cation:proton antiporter [Endobacter medicaginis]MBB3172958.1 CPA1 family monovalent cation:H+ antiporter [Endobacter medicaginis]MCX5476243.1 cation:proton antiporter [Endobacter medicaginis]NVN29692.1 cation:proton antiporter [Endobacter medicaginis]